MITPSCSYLLWGLNLQPPEDFTQKHFTTKRFIHCTTCPYLPTLYDTSSIFKRSLTSLNSEFSFSLTCCPTKAEEPSLSYYLSKAGGSIIGFIPFPRVLVLCEMQSVSFMIWTRVAVSISYDDNRYTTDTVPRVLVKFRGIFFLLINLTSPSTNEILFTTIISDFCTLSHIEFFVYRTVLNNGSEIVHLDTWSTQQVTVT